MARAFRAVAIASAVAWVALIAWTGYFRFDDFWSIHHSRGAHLFSGAAWQGLTADGRWQPLMSAAFDAVASVAGTSHAWPWYLAVALAHALGAAFAAGIAQAIWRERDASTDAFAIALASLNLSAFSLATIATLHGVMSTTASAASAFFAVAAMRSAGTRAALCALTSAAAALAACLFKESGVTAPALALFCGVLMTDARAAGARRAFRAALPAIAGVAAYLALRMLLGIPLSPGRTRYVLSPGPHSAINAAIVAGLGLLWMGPAAAGLLRTSAGGLRRTACAIGALTLVWMLLACAPALFLKWRSPGFWHLLVPGIAIGTTALVRLARRAGASRLSYAAMTAVSVLLFVSVTATYVRSGGLEWGRLTRSVVEDWMRLRQPGDGRVIWIDRDQLAWYGGLARIIGPGHRLSYALSMVTNQHVDARVCASLPVGPIYEPLETDAVFEHSGGHLTRVPLPAERFHCLP